MNAYFDTSALLPILLDRHVNHSPARALLRLCLGKQSRVFTTTHTYGEMYNHLTRNVAPFELTPDRARHVLLSVLPDIIEFRPSPGVYTQAIDRCSQLGLSQANIYDAVHLEAAIAGRATVLYTDNVKDFTALLTPKDTLAIQGIR